MDAIKRLSKDPVPAVRLQIADNLGALWKTCPEIVKDILSDMVSAEARLARRRRKNYGHTVSKGKGPTIKLAVKAED